MNAIRVRSILLGLWLLCGMGGLLVWLYQFGQVLFATRRCWRLCLAWDDLGNVALGGRLGQTISTKCALACRDGKWWGKFGCWILNGVDPGHCAEAVAFDESRRTAS